MSSPSFSSPKKASHDVAPQDHLTRRCPLYTCGVSLLSIAHISLVKSQGLSGRIGLIVRLMTYVIALARPFIRLMCFFLFSGLLFVDGVILTFGGVVEILFPPFVGLFDEINKVIYSIEILPEKLGHVMNKFPNSINEIPALDNFLALVASRIEIYLSQPGSRTTKSKGEDGKVRKCSDCETPNNQEDGYPKLHMCLQSSDNMEKLEESHSTADDDSCGQGVMDTESYEVDSPETEKVSRDGEGSLTAYDEENRDENDREKQFEHDIGEVEATTENTNVEHKTEEEEKGFLEEDGGAVHKTAGEKNMEELETKQQKSEKETEVLLESEEQQSVKLLESEEQLEIEDELKREEQKAEQKLEKEEQKAEENRSEKMLETEKKSEKLEKEKQKAEENISGEKLEKEGHKSEQQKLEDEKLEERKSKKLEREEHNLGEKKWEEQGKTEVNKTEEQKLEKLKTKQETKELRRKEKLEVEEQQRELKVAEEQEGGAMKEEEGESLVKYWDAAEQRGEETEPTKKKVLKEDNKDTGKGKREKDEGEDEKKEAAKKKREEEARKGKKAVLGNSILELFDRSWHKKSPTKK